MLPKKKTEPVPAPAPNPSNSTIDQLHQRLGDLADQAKVMQNVADQDKRPLNGEEMTKLDEIHGEFEAVEAEIKSRARTSEMEERINALAQPAGRKGRHDDLPVASQQEDDEEQPRRRPYGSSAHGGMQPGTTKGTFGFRSLGDWAVAASRTSLGKQDQRIVNAPTTFGQEGVSSDGGFAVPPDFRANIMKLIQAEEALLGRCDQQITSSNSLSLPLDTTTPWQTSGGVIPAWLGEGGTLTQSKPNLAMLETKLNKLGALVPITDELLQDVPALTSWLQTKVPEKFISFINDAIVNGNGVAKPQGLLNAGCKVTQAAVSGQGNGTIIYANITNMWARLYGRLRPDAVWLVNQDIEPQLQQMAFPAAAGSAVFPAYMPPGGLSASPYGTLMGRPIVPIEACATVGTEGDIILTALPQYLVALKSDGMRSDVSIHLYFDTDHTAFRFVMRVGGQSYWPSAVTRAHGSNTLSPIVTLNSNRT